MINSSCYSGPSLLSRGKADFVVFHPPGKFLDGIFHSVNLRMGLVQEQAEGKMRIAVPTGTSEYAVDWKRKQFLSCAVRKANLLVLIHKQIPLK